MNICKYIPTKYLDDKGYNDRFKFLFKNVCYLLGQSGGGIQSVVAGTGITVDNTDPLNPIISSSGGGIIVGTTTITSGATKRIPFNNAGIYGESANLIWDNTNGSLGVGSSTSSTSGRIAISGGPAWTTAGWNKGLNLQGINVMEIGGGSSRPYGIGVSSGKLFMFYSNGETSGDAISYTLVSDADNTGFAGITAPTAKIHINLGSAAAGGAPLKLTSGTNLTTPEAGALEYTTPQLFFTNGGLQRQEIPQIQQSRVATQFDKTDTTLANVTGLTATLVAGKIYRFEAKLYTTSNSAGGVKVTMNGTATISALIFATQIFDFGLSTALTCGVGNGLGSSVGVTTVANAFIMISGTITVNQAGTLTVQFAQNTTNGTASSVLIGSTFTITETI